MRRVIADAAQRRIEVTNGCASGSDNVNDLAEEASRNGSRTKAEEDDANEQAIMQAYIELIQQEERERYGPSYIPPSEGNPAGPRSHMSPPPIPEGTKPSSSTAAPTPTPPQPDPVDLISDSSAYDQPWTCTTCTLENPPNFLCCDVCAAERPRPSNSRSVSGPPPSREPKRTSPAGAGAAAPRNKNKRPFGESTSQTGFRNRTRAVESLAALDRDAQKRPLGWICQACGSFMQREFWTCSNCGLMKSSS